MMASAPLVVQCMPACLRRWPTTVLQVASTTPEPANAVLVRLVLGEEDGELYLAGAGAAVLALAGPPSGLLRGHGHAAAVDHAVELVWRRRQRHQLPGVDQR